MPPLVIRTRVPRFSGSRRATLVCFLRLFIALLFVAGSIRDAMAAYALSAEEQAVANLMINDPQQHRSGMVLDPILARVARERAQDLAARNYFSHVNPDGYGPNYLVQQAGYTLPAWWGSSPTANYIESIAAGHTSPAAVYTGWMNSPPHRTHILALDPFYTNQTSYGVGYAYIASGNYHHYWVIITAPPSSASANAALFIGQSVPSNMQAGLTYNVSVQMLNTGSQTWSEGSLYRLASQSPTGNTTWGQSRVTLPNNVGPGDSVTLNFIVTAPSVAGTYAFQWQMIQENTGYFGELTNLVNVLVQSPAAAPSSPPPASTYTPPPSSSSSASSSSGSSSSKSKKSKKKKKAKKKAKKKKK